MRQTEWWRDLFGTPSGDLSVARLQIVWGAIVLVGYVLLFVCARAHAAEPPSALFVNGLIVLLAGAAALMLETWIERLPDLASWSAPLVPEPAAMQNEAAAQPRYWLDITVLQLILGAVVIPCLSSLPVLEAVGWRLVTITVASELVYLAFLIAQLVQKDELKELFAAIKQARESIARLTIDPAAPAGATAASQKAKEEKLKPQAKKETEKQDKKEKERENEQENEKEKLKLLESRAEVLMRRIGRTFVATGQTT